MPITIPTTKQDRDRLVAKGNAILQTAKADGREITDAELAEVDAILSQIDDMDLRGADTFSPPVNKLRNDRRWAAVQPTHTDPEPLAGDLQGNNMIVPPSRPGEVARYAGPAGQFSPSMMPNGDNCSRSYAALFGEPGRPLDNGGFGTMEDYFQTLNAGMQDNRLIPMASLGTGMGSGGGFLVPEQHVAQMLDASLENEIVRPRCDVQPMTSTRKKIAGWDSADNSSSSLFGGFSGQWVAEGEDATLEDPKTRMIQLIAKKLFLLTSSSNELIADGMTFEQMLTGALVKAIGWHLDDACLNGTGAGQPLGVLNDPAMIEVAKEDEQTAATITYPNLCNMFARLHPACVSKSVWVCNSTCIPQLLQLTISVGDGGDHYPVLTGSDGNWSMLTRPVLFTEKTPALGSAGDVLLADFSQYTLGLRKEVAIEKSGHVFFQSDRSAYRGILRGDGQGRWAKAFTPKNGDTLSWCVTLAERA